MWPWTWSPRARPCSSRAASTPRPRSTPCGRASACASTATCATPAPRDHSFPKGGFLVLGPLPGNRDFDVDAFAGRVLAEAKPKPCEALYGSVQACWQEPPPFIQDPLHPEIIPAGGLMAPRTYYTWDSSVYYGEGHKLHYLLMTEIYSPVSRTARAVLPRRPVKRLVLNGKRLRGRTLKLHAGANRLAIYYAAGTSDEDGEANFNEKNYGPYFILLGPDGTRLPDVRYEVPRGLSLTPRPEDP